MGSGLSFDAPETPKSEKRNRHVTRLVDIVILGMLLLSGAIIMMWSVALFMFDEGATEVLWNGWFSLWLEQNSVLINTGRQVQDWFRFPYILVIVVLALPAALRFTSQSRRRRIEDGKAN